MTLRPTRRRIIAAAASGGLLPFAPAWARKPLRGGIHSYHADAVHFDGATSLSIGALTSPSDNGKLTNASTSPSD